MTSLRDVCVWLCAVAAVGILVAPSGVAEAAEKPSLSDTIPVGLGFKPRKTPRLECVFNHDCNDERLICVGEGYCRAQCKTDLDCAAGWTCELRDRNGLGKSAKRPPRAIPGTKALVSWSAYGSDELAGVCKAPPTYITGRVESSPGVAAARCEVRMGELRAKCTALGEFTFHNVAIRNHALHIRVDHPGGQVGYRMVRITPNLGLRNDLGFIVVPAGGKP